MLETIRAWLVSFKKQRCMLLLSNIKVPCSRFVIASDADDIDGVGILLGNVRGSTLAEYLANSTRKRPRSVIYLAFLFRK